MAHSILKLFISFNLLFVSSYGQTIRPNICDSTLLTQEAYEKCQSDSAWSVDLLVKSNYITKFKTGLLPKYRIQRKGLSIPFTLQESLQQLKIVYDSVLNKKLSVFMKEMDRNQNYVQPKAYLSSLLSFQIFRFYPDVYAILLNDIHLALSPTTTIEEQKKYQQLFSNTLHSIPPDLYQKLLKISGDLTAEHAELLDQGFTQLFRGAILEKDRTQYDIVNFLLWAE